MMQAALPRSWKQEFAFAAAMREEDAAYREKMARFEARQRVMRENERIGEEKRSRETFDTLRTALATERQVVVFREKLDRYDEKTVESLMENRVALEQVQKRLDDMLNKAHVLPDGRRVFRTQDGTRVFDETGLELNAEVIDPGTIGDWHPAWERYKPDLDAKGRLLKEQADLHAFQEKADAARAEMDRGDMTAERLDELEAGLSATMPEAVRRKLGIEAPQQGMGPAAPGQPQPDTVRAEPAQQQKLTPLSPM